MPAPAALDLTKSCPTANQIGDSESSWFGVSRMFAIDPQVIFAIAALVTSLSALIWSFRRKPE